MERSPRSSDQLPLLFFADGYKFPDVYHATKLLTPDPIIVLEHAPELVVVASSLEEGRARKDSRATKVHNTNEFGNAQLASKGITGPELNATVMKRFLDARGLLRSAGRAPAGHGPGPGHRRRADRHGHLSAAQEQPLLGRHDAHGLEGRAPRRDPQDVRRRHARAGRRYPRAAPGGDRARRERDRRG